MLENRANLTDQVNLFEGHLNGRVYEYNFHNCTQQQFHQLSLHHYPYTSDLNTGVTMQRLEANEIMYVKVFEPWKWPRNCINEFHHYTPLINQILIHDCFILCETNP